MTDIDKEKEAKQDPTPEVPTPEAPDNSDEKEVKASLSAEQMKELEGIAADRAKSVMADAEGAIQRGIDDAKKSFEAKNGSKPFNIVSKLASVDSKNQNEHLRLYLKATATGSVEDSNNLKKFVADANSGIRQADDPGGADLVPQSLRREVAWVEETAGWTFANTTTITVDPGVTKIELPTAGTVAVNWVGEGAGRARTGEAETIGASKPDFNKVDLDMRKIAAIVPMSKEMLDGSVEDLDTLVRALVINRISHAVDTQFQSGNNTAGRPAGLLTQGTSVAIASSTYRPATAVGRVKALNEAELVFIKKAHRTRTNRYGSMGNASWYLSPEQYDAMSIARADTTNALLYPQLSTAANPRVLRGNVIEMPETPDIDATKSGERIGIYGDLSQVVVGMAPSFDITSSNTATFVDTGGTNLQSAFSNDLYAVRVIFSVGSAVLAPNELSTIHLP